MKQQFWVHDTKANKKEVKESEDFFTLCNELEVYKNPYLVVTKIG